MEQMSGAGTSNRSAAAPTPGRLSHAQRMIWAGQALHPEVPLYNMAFGISIDGDLDTDAFRQAFAAVVAASDSLRTVIVDHDGDPARLVLPDLSYEMAVHDFTGHHEPYASAEAWMTERAGHMLDAGELLFESALLRLGAHRHIWFFNQHHLIADAWSLAVVFAHVESAYRSIVKGEQPAVTIPPYQDLIDAEVSDRGRSLVEAAHEHWRSKLEAADDAPQLYGSDRRHPSTESVRLRRRLDRERSQALHQLAERTDIRALTPDMTMFGLFASVLMAWMWRIGGQDQIALGTPTHNRETPQFRDTTGVFIELFPLVAELAPDETFTSLNRKLQAESLSLLRHAHPGASLPELARMFNVVLNYITVNLGAFAGMPVATRWIHNGHVDPGHHLRLQIHDLDSTGEVELLFDFTTAVFDTAQQTFAMDHIFRLLDAMVEDPGQPIAEVELTGSEERRRLLAVAATAPGKDPGGETAVSRFADQVARRPSRVAVVAEDGSLSYAELDRRAARLAQHLLSVGAGPDRVVALCTDRSLDMIVAILGIQKAGAAYLPLSPDDPPDRRNRMLEASDALAVVANRATGPLLVDCPRPVLGVDDLAAPDPQPPPPAPSAVTVRPEHLAYVLFTSGSTGVPKAVMVEHRNLLSLVDGLDERVYRDLASLEDGGANVALVAPYVFDPSVQQIFGALLGGHTLHIVPEADRVDGARLYDFLAHHRIDVSDGTPAHLRMLVDGSDRDLAKLPVRHFFIGGEAMPKELVRRFLGSYTGNPPIVTNAYGPAECCVDCVAWRVTEDSLDRYDTVPLGTPLPGERAYVLDEHLRLQPFGVVGELCLGGSGVGRGYLDDAELTAERFVENPFEPGTRLYRTGDLARQSPEGVLEFVGRKDTQVKVRGHRIELGEVEAALKRFKVRRAYLPITAVNEPAESQRCTRCLLSEFHPGVTLDRSGVCNVCRQFDNVRDDVLNYFRPFEEFEALVASAREKNRSDYDCMVLYSGGKDSSYVLYRLADMGLRVLAYTFDNGHISPAAFRNIERQTGLLGVDSVVSGTDRMDEVFLESLNDDSTVCSGCFRALTAISTRLAQDHRVKVVVTGLSRGQMFDTKLSGLVKEGVRDIAEIETKLQLFRRGYHARNDRTAALLDVDLGDVDLDTFDFVDFFRYDDTPTAQVHAYLRERDSYWRQPEDTGFCSTNCQMNDVGIAVHSANQGYHNYEAPLSWDIRLGVARREDVLEEVAPVRNVRHVERVLGQIGYLNREIRDAAVVVNEDASGGRQLWAYYTASQTLTVAELRAHLARTLPDYMIPSRFVQVDEIPLTPNGKVDRDALRPDTSRPELGTAVVAPTNPAERKLAAIWADVLGVEDIGIHDSFFDLGGDSINAIQIVSRAKSAGLAVSASQLFDTLTVAGLAAVAEISEDEPHDGGPSEGPIGFLPAQRWLIELRQPSPELWSHVLHIAVPPDAGPAALTQGMDRWVERHPAFRQSFRADAAGDWSTEVHAAAQMPPLRIEDVAGLDAAAREQVVKDVEHDLIHSIELGRPPLLRAAYLHDPDGSDFAVLVAHHHVVDAVSWTALIDELNDPGPSPSGTSLFRWTGELRGYASEERPEERAHWREVAGMTLRPAPRDIDQPGAATFASETVLTVEMDDVRSADLAHRAPRAGRVTIHELLVTALARTIGGWTESRELRIFVEGHGRDTFNHLDVSRTVGWFTSIYPVALRLPAVDDPAAVVTHVKTQLRDVPAHGAGYGAFRYLDPRPESHSSLDLATTDHVLFNYFGRGDAIGGDPLQFRPARPVALVRGPGNQRPFLIEVAARFVEGRLVVEWSYSDQRHMESTVQMLADSMLGHLDRVIDACLHGATANAGDFPLAQLDDRTLGQLAAILGRNRDMS